MGLIAQLHHHEERLNLGRGGRCLFVFMCSNPDSRCDATWESAEGCNSSFVLEPEDLNTGITYPWDVVDPESAEVRACENCAYNQSWDAERTIWIETEIRILEWIGMDDNIPDSARSYFTDEEKYGEASEGLLQQQGGDMGSSLCFILMNDTLTRCQDPFASNTQVLGIMS